MGNSSSVIHATSNLKKKIYSQTNILPVSSHDTCDAVVPASGKAETQREPHVEFVGQRQQSQQIQHEQTEPERTVVEALSSMKSGVPVHPFSPQAGEKSGKTTLSNPVFNAIPEVLDIATEKQMKISDATEAIGEIAKLLNCEVKKEKLERDLKILFEQDDNDAQKEGNATSAKEDYNAPKTEKLGNSWYASPPASASTTSASTTSTSTTSASTTSVSTTGRADHSPGRVDHGPGRADHGPGSKGHGIPKWIASPPGWSGNPYQASSNLYGPGIMQGKVVGCQRGWGQAHRAAQGHPTGIPSVLVVGAGITGSMVAHKIRKLHPDIHLAVWECARGCAGKFASRRYEGQDTCDLGGQVFTVINGDQLAQQEIQMLCERGLCRLASGLTETETRSQCRNPQYYHSEGSKVMRWYLDNAQLNDLRFNCRVTRIEKGYGGGKWQVTSVEGNVSDPCGPQVFHATHSEEFDSVVVCGDAQDALQIAQSGHDVSDAVKQYLESVSYDTRLCFGFVFDDRLNAHFNRFFHGTPERKVDNDVIHMVYSMAAKNQSRIGTITVHCTRSFTESLMRQNSGDIRRQGMALVLMSLASILGCSHGELEACLKHFDGVHWRRCQATPPAVPMQDPAFTRFPGCAVIASNPSFVICGDHMMGMCCFTGVVRTATSGAAAVAESISANDRGRNTDMKLSPVPRIGHEYGLRPLLEKSWLSPNHSSKLDGGILDNDSQYSQTLNEGTDISRTLRNVSGPPKWLTSGSGTNDYWQNFQPKQWLPMPF